MKHLICSACGRDFGGWPVVPAETPCCQADIIVIDDPVQTNLEYVPSGFGIGGYGSDDYNMRTEYTEPLSTTREVFGDYQPRGQLWQECEVHGCHNEPVCLSCLRCEARHCHCGG